MEVLVIFIFGVITSIIRVFIIIFFGFEINVTVNVNFFIGASIFVINIYMSL